MIQIGVRKLAGLDSPALQRLASQLIGWEIEEDDVDCLKNPNGKLVELGQGTGGKVSVPGQHHIYMKYIQVDIIVYNIIFNYVPVQLALLEEVESLCWSVAMMQLQPHHMLETEGHH